MEIHFVIYPFALYYNIIYHACQKNLNKNNFDSQDKLNKYQSITQIAINFFSKSKSWIKVKPFIMSPEEQLQNKPKQPKRLRIILEKDFIRVFFSYYYPSSSEFYSVSSYNKTYSSVAYLQINSFSITNGIKTVKIMLHLKLN